MFFKSLEAKIMPAVRSCLLLVIQSKFADKKEVKLTALHVEEDTTIFISFPALYANIVLSILL